MEPFKVEKGVVLGYALLRCLFRQSNGEIMKKILAALLFLTASSLSSGIRLETFRTLARHSRRSCGSLCQTGSRF